MHHVLDFSSYTFLVQDWNWWPTGVGERKWMEGQRSSSTSDNIYAHNDIRLYGLLPGASCVLSFPREELPKRWEKWNDLMVLFGAIYERKRFLLPCTLRLAGNWERTCCYPCGWLGPKDEVPYSVLCFALWLQIQPLPSHCTISILCSEVEEEPTANDTELPTTSHRMRAVCIYL